MTLDRSGDGPDTGFGDQFDADIGIGVGVVQIENQLLQIFNGINVMMRRRRNESHPGSGMPDLGDVFTHLVARKLPAFARLGPLRDLDLQFIGIGQIVAVDTEASGSHLLDLASARIAVGIGNITDDVLAAFPGITFAAEPVHGDGQGFVGFA